MTTPTLVIRMPDDLYLRRLRVLGAWWCLGSSALEPGLLARYLPATPRSLREAGL